MVEIISKLIKKEEVDHAGLLKLREVIDNRIKEKEEFNRKEKNDNNTSSKYKCLNCGNSLTFIYNGFDDLDDPSGDYEVYECSNEDCKLQHRVDADLDPNGYSCEMPKLYEPRNCKKSKKKSLFW